MVLKELEFRWSMIARQGRALLLCTSNDLISAMPSDYRLLILPSLVESYLFCYGSCKLLQKQCHAAIGVVWMSSDAKPVCPTTELQVV